MFPESERQCPTLDLSNAEVAYGRLEFTDVLCTYLTVHHSLCAAAKIY